MESIAKEQRKQKRLAKLGSNNPICTVCAEDNWECLEQHHIAGKKYADDLVTICANCHCKLSDEQKNHPAQLGEPPTNLERIGRFLLGLADLFELLVEKCREFGSFLIETAKGVATA